MKSHLISQVVLKQFADPKRQIVVHTKCTNDTEIKPIGCVAYVNIDESLIRKLEEKWSQEIETKAEAAINNLRAGNINYVEKHIGIVKSLLALHFIRSQVFQLVQINKQVIDSRLTQAKDGVLALFPDKKDVIDEAYTQHHATAYVDVAIKVLEKFIPKVDDYIKDSTIGFEIGEAPDGSEFIIGDVPVITADGSGRFGALNGVPITEAKSVGMPLTPKYLITLKKHPKTKKYIKLTKQQVKNANDRQFYLMQNHYYSTATYKV